MVNLGIIGLGACWEPRYLPALQAMRSRIRVCAVYDAVPSRAAVAADVLDAEPVGSLHALLRRRDVRGVLLLGTGWQGIEPLRFAVAQAKPTLIAAPLATSVETLARLHLAGLSHGLTLMPEFPRRYAPSTQRLMELLATQVGPPREIRVELAVDGGELKPSADVVELTDWCRHVARTPPASVEASRLDANGRRGVRVRVEYRRPRGHGFMPTAEVVLRERTTAEATVTEPSVTVRGDHGEVVVEGLRRLRWSGRQGERVERLDSERPETEVLLDHFCRRVVGGLIPVADLADLTSHLRLLEDARRSLDTGRPVRVSEHA